MNWFRQNRFLGWFLIGFGLTTLLALVFLWRAMSRYDDAQTQFTESASELNRLERLSPFPTEENLEKMKTHGQEYGVELTKVKEDLQKRMLPAPPMAPNEFQTRLNQARAAFAEKARANKVKLPDNFFLGFEEFAGSLPDTAATPLLGQELAQVELLLNTLVDAHIDAITSLRRVKPTASPTPTPIPGRKPTPAPKVAAKPAQEIIGRNVVELGFSASPSAMRRALNQIATADQQFYIIRTLDVLNQQDKGPPREGAPGAPPPAPSPGASPGATPSLSFIVGNEHLDATARVEMVRFNF